MLVGKSAGQPGDWLRQELTRRGYDPKYGGQSQFARAAGMHVSIVNRALQGKGVTLDVLRRMGRALGYNLGDMLVLSGMAEREELPVRPPEELEDAPSPEPDESPYTDERERQIWAWNLPQDVREQVVLVLRALIQHREEKDERPDAEVHDLRSRRPS